METNEYENLSRQIFLYLSQVIGSQKVVHSRRVFLHVLDASLSHRVSEAIQASITSGSKGEGLDMFGSDLDIMMLLTQYPVFHERSEINRSLGLIPCLTDTENAPPGFVYLQTMCNPCDCRFVTMSEYGPMLSNINLKDIIFRRCQNLYGNLSRIHGPCVSTKFRAEEYDLAICVRSHTWPKIAKEWFKRPRHFGWPSASLEEMCAIHGLLYVPIGSKFGGKENNPLQWRISFSVQEKLLVYSFNHTQLLCYALLKIILKEIINTQTHISNLLCSYFMKTAVFWMCEEADTSKWGAERLLRCLKSCIRRLIYFVSIANCPNYFIPENNMFEGKIYGKNQNDLLSVLEHIFTVDIHAILALPTLTHFIPGEISMQSYVWKNEVDVGLYPVLHRLTSLSKTPYPGIEILWLLTKFRKQTPSLYKSVCVLLLAQNCMGILTKIPDNWQYNNKHFYQQYKHTCSYALIGRNIDTVSGWLGFATFLYQHKQYHHALVVTSSILRECNPDKIYIVFADLQKIDFAFLSTKGLTFYQRHKLFCIHQMSIHADYGSVFYNSDLVMYSCIYSPPIVYLHYLRFWCFHRLRNISERNKCLINMELTIENEFFVNSRKQRVISYHLLLEALKIANDCFNNYEIVNQKLLLEYHKVRKEENDHVRQ